MMPTVISLTRTRVRRGLSGGKLGISDFSMTVSPGQQQR